MADRYKAIATGDSRGAVVDGDGKEVYFATGRKAVDDCVRAAMFLNAYARGKVRWR